MDKKERIEDLHQRYANDDSSKLDETIHDVLSEVASSINNDGIEAQIEFMIEKLGLQETELILKETFDH